ncbi:MAG: hypothetical protein MHPSP_004087, partial [Paramarteilia canceri]
DLLEILASPNCLSGSFIVSKEEIWAKRMQKYSLLPLCLLDLSTIRPTLAKIYDFFSSAEEVPRMIEAISICSQKLIKCKRISALPIFVILMQFPQLYNLGGDNVQLRQQCTILIHNMLQYFHNLEYSQKETFIRFFQTVPSLYMARMLKNVIEVMGKTVSEFSENILGFVNSTSNSYFEKTFSIVFDCAEFIKTIKQINDTLPIKERVAGKFFVLNKLDKMVDIQKDYEIFQYQKNCTNQSKR